ncbi:MAG: Cys-tRNA(Pro) deacylase [Parahaliea sp.]
MTPAVDVVRRAKIPFTLHQYNHDPTVASYGEEAADSLGLPREQVFKTLVVDIGGNNLVVAIVPVSSSLNLKKLARAAGVKRAKMAVATAVERSSGYVLGGVSPLGQKRKLPTFVDSSAKKLLCVYVSAGRRGLEIALAPTDLLTLTRAEYFELSE